MVDYSGAISIPNQNFFAGRNGLIPRYIILHGTAGGTSAVAIANYFASTQNTANPVTSTYVIGVDGEVVQCVAERDGAWGNGAYTAGHAPFWDTSVNPNNITISIEHCKPSGDNSDVLTTKQQAASFKLQNDICDRWNIPKRAADASGGITGHFSIDPVNRSNCPGPYDWNALWSFLKNPSTQTQEEDVVSVLDLVTTPGVSGYFAASENGAWKCTAHGHQYLVLGNILSFYKRIGQEGLNGITFLGLPLTEMFVLKTGKAWGQLFEHGFVIDDIDRLIDRPVGIPATQPCYLGHVDTGQGLTLISQPVVVPLQNQIKSLDAQLADAQKNGGDPAQIAALEATITSLQGDVAAGKTKMNQAIALLQK